MSATQAVQAAAYGVLKADTVLPTMSLSVDTRTGTYTTVGVYNDVPEGATYPHILISRATERPWHTFGGPTTGLGWKNTLRVHIYSRAQGDKEGLEILSRVVTLLNFQALSVSGYTTALVEYEQGRLLVEAIEKMETRHVVAEFSVMVH